MSYKKMTIDGDEWVITWYPGLLGMQKNGVKKFVHVLRSYECCWKLRKKAIEANGGAEGLFYYLSRHYDENFCMCFVKKILCFAFDEMREAK